MAKRTVDVELDIRKVTLEKQGLLVWGEIASNFDALVNDVFNEFENATESNFGSAMLKLVREHIPTVISILEIATPLTRTELEKDIDPSEVLELVYAVIEVNQLFRANDQIKKIKALFKR